MTSKQRKLFFYRDYFESFYLKQKEKVKEKIIWTFDLIQEVENVPEKYLKHLAGTEGLYEIRVQLGNNIFRIFCFFDSGNLVVIMNGFQKKTNKTPKKEIEKALKIRRQYEYEKQHAKS